VNCDIINLDRLSIFVQDLIVYFVDEENNLS
jgi:hypothetical protein